MRHVKRVQYNVSAIRVSVAGEGSEQRFHRIDLFEARAKARRPDSFLQHLRDRVRLGPVAALRNERAGINSRLNASLGGFALSRIRFELQALGICITAALRIFSQHVPAAAFNACMAALDLAPQLLSLVAVERLKTS